MAVMKWSEFKAFVDEALRKQGLEDAPIDWIDVHMPDLAEERGWGRPEAHVGRDGTLVID